MHNLDDKHPTRPGFEHRTSEMCSVKFVLSSGLCVSTIFRLKGKDTRQDELTQFPEVQFTSVCRCHDVARCTLVAMATGDNSQLIST